MKKLLKLLFCISLIVLIPAFMYIISTNTFTINAQAIPLKDPNPEGGPIITSDKYIISEDYKIIYTKTDVDVNTILSNITVKNGSISIANNILYLSNKEKFKNNIGDINGDNKITVEDYELIFQYKSGAVELDAEALKRADADGDGTVTLNDALAIQNYVNAEEIIVEYKIVSISSTKYDLTEDFLILADGDTSFDLNNIIVTNGDKEYKDNKLLIKYEEYELDSYDVETINGDEPTEEPNPGTSDISVTIILILLVIVTVGLVSVKKKINKIK